MNVLFITHARLDRHAYGDGSTRYRCFNHAEVLQDNNHQAEVQSLTNLRASDLGRYDIVSCLRPIYCQKLQQVSDFCRAQGIHLIADFDDLLFDPTMAERSPKVLNSQASVAHVQNQFRKHARSLPLFDELTVSTPALASAARKQCAHTRITVLRNGLSAYWLQHAEQARGTLTGGVRLSYLPGNRSHDRDLRFIAPTLGRFLKAHPQAILSLVGKVGLRGTALPREQLHLTPWVDYYSLPELIAQSRVTLAPLLDTPFNFAKSHIKFIESAALGVPALCSPTSDLLEHDIDGLTIIKYESDWEHALNCTVDPDYRAACGDALINYATQHCTAQAQYATVLKHWDSSEYWNRNRSAMSA
ncbi:glycosyltransferase family protein [Granulosicoccus antarcticus]|uniref:Spore protein YkvP/CgeB glycosyl transferase-like domain-containing protein n=1 Tax=Granulosicoccus antarcticus IMCC3135 TaxID=1192854 RepID=A0A2Z2NKH8_9GAMM|nr:glycosyltransferase family 1 protein [Granulosicoccus antarcticus]ASJ71679.1 hypothetical protein IMCC3135_07880 [Granulosicoccus antarcticus IMCC3135]